MNRFLVELISARVFDDLAEVHDRDPVGHVPHDTEVMSHEEVGQTELVLHFLEQIDDLRLYGYVQRRDGFIGHDQLGPQRKCTGDADPLTLPAGELVREAVVVLGLQTDAVEQLLHPAFQLGTPSQPVQLEGIADDLAHPLARVERRERVLEDHLHLAANGT